LFFLGGDSKPVRLLAVLDSLGAAKLSASLYLRFGEFVRFSVTDEEDSFRENTS
jgi:hypothetical protein